MRNKILLIIVMLLAGWSALSAHDKDGKTKADMLREIQEFKMKYLAQEMDLKEDQQQRFITLYTELSDKRAETMKEARALEKKIEKSSAPTEKDYKALTDAMNKAKVESAAVEKEYDDKFSEFLSQKQIVKMKNAEEEFRVKMQEMRKSKKGKEHHRENRGAGKAKR